MSTDLREAFRRAADAVTPLGDAERAVRSGRRRRRASIVAAPLAVLVVVGGVWLVGAGSLGGDEPPVVDTSPSPVTAADLAGRAFVTTEGQPDDATVVLMFDSTELTVTATTSRHTAGYRIVDDVLNPGTSHVPMRRSRVRLRAAGSDPVTTNSQLDRRGAHPDRPRTRRDDDRVRRHRGGRR